MAGASLFQVTSGQVERMCRDRPPTASSVPRVKKRDDARMMCESAEAGLVLTPARSKLPSLNTDDVLEVLIMQKRQGKLAPSHPRTVKVWRNKRAPASITTLRPVAEEMEQEVSSPVSWTSGFDQKDFEEPWPCQQCTFINAACMESCEMCGSAWQWPSEVVPVSECRDAAESAWLAQSADSECHWSQCEISSVASSWLDVGDAVDDTDTHSFIDIDENLSISSFLLVDESNGIETASAASDTSVTDATAGRTSLSWAAIASSRGSPGSAVVCKQIPMPPLKRANPMRRKLVPKAVDEDDLSAMEEFPQSHIQHRGRQWQKHSCHG